MARTYSFFGEEFVKGIAREIEEEVDALDVDLKRVVGGSDGRGLRMDAPLSGSAVLMVYRDCINIRI
jgi:hypothetical protein